MPTDDEPLQIGPGGPALALAAAIPLIGVALIALGASRGAMDTSVDSPVSPWLVAVITLAGTVALSWRALTQTATLDGWGVVSRNLTSTVRAPWSSVEELRVVARPGVVMVEIHVLGLRRQQRLGAATRWSGEDAESTVARLAAHPCAGALLTRVDP